jgi:hypothetical protein
MFCQMENADRQLIWAKFDRADWELARQHLLPVVYRTRALGIRQQHCFQRGAVVKSLFVRGPITITHGDREGGVSRWSSGTPNRYNQTDRPGSYDVSCGSATRKNLFLEPDYRTGSCKSHSRHGVGQSGGLAVVVHALLR